MPISSDNEYPSTAGWDAIDSALARVYGAQEPQHWGTAISYMLGGPDPLDGISAYMHAAPGTPSHWHYVSFGMSELYAKENETKEVSGWGFEFTFRLKCDTEVKEPPIWPAHMLQNLARYVCNSGNRFAAGHHLPLNGPIAQGRETAIRAAMFIEDPELAMIETPNGRLQFLQLVGTTMDELASARGWNTGKFLAMMSESNPLLITDLERKSILVDPAVKALVAAKSAQDGSSTGWFGVRELSIKVGTASPGRQHLTVVIGASGVTDVQALLRGRIPFDRPFVISGPETTVKFAAGPAFGWASGSTANEITVSLTAAQAFDLAEALKPVRGEYSVAGLPGLLLKVVPSNIMDHTGKIVVEVIG